MTGSLKSSVWLPIVVENIIRNYLQKKSRNNQAYFLKISQVLGYQNVYRLCFVDYNFFYQNK